MSVVTRIRQAIRQPIKQKVEALLAPHIQIGGQNPWDIQVTDGRFYEALALKGTLGLGESYMNGWWNVSKNEALDKFFTLAIRAGLLDRFRYHPNSLYPRIIQRTVNQQRVSRAQEVADHHYTPEATVIDAFIGDVKLYSCGYWPENVHDIETAQFKKMELICQKLKLRMGMRVYDIGCGYGMLAEHMAKHYGCHVVGVTVSDAQAESGRKRCAGLSVDIRCCDYRSVNERFDRIVSVGMFEHVGHKNYQTYMEVAARCLEPEGSFLLHTIGKGSEDLFFGEPWLLKYIFPNAMLPTPNRITRAFEGIFDEVHFQELGENYDPTLMAWRGNLLKTWSQFPGHSEAGYNPWRDPKFRMWYYYLSSCAALFRTRKLKVWHYLLKHAGSRGYKLSCSERCWL